MGDDGKVRFVRESERNRLLGRRGPRWKYNIHEFIGRTNQLFPLIPTQTKRDTLPIILLLFGVFIAARTCLPIRCLETEPLPRNNERDAHRGNKANS
jgi:hypothetical protein